MVSVSNDGFPVVGQGEKPCDLSPCLVWASALPASCALLSHVELLIPPRFATSPPSCRLGTE